MASGTVLTIGEVARRTGLSESALRYYEQAGLVGPIERDASSGHRRYDQPQVERLMGLACLRGLPIDELRRYVDLMTDDDAAEPLIELFDRHAASLGEEIRALGQRRRYLELKASLWRARVANDGAAEQAAIVALETMLSSSAD